MHKKAPRGVKKLFLVSFFLFSCISSFSQTQNQKSEFWNKVRFGGGIGLNFVNGGFNGSIAPSAIYQFNNKIALGTSLNFNYSKFNNSKLLAYGGSVLSLYNPIQFLQASVELEQLRINRSFDTSLMQLEDNYWSPALFLGLGYTSNNFTVGVRYDVLYNDQKSIYANAWLPFVRVFF